MGQGVAAAAACPPAAKEQPALAVRVREVGAASGGAFRRVVLRAKGADGEGAPSFAEVERRVADKFRSARGLDGQDLGPRRLVALVRLRDSLEIADDEDAALLEDGDELEAKFVAESPFVLPPSSS